MLETVVHRDRSRVRRRIFRWKYCSTDMIAIQNVVLRRSRTLFFQWLLTHSSGDVTDDPR
jgi:hypothetical protein